MPEKLYPLGISYLGAYLRSAGFSAVTLIDLNAEIFSTKNVLVSAVSFVESSSPNLLGLTCTTVQAPFVIDFVKEYKKKHPGVPIVLGGVHASTSFRELMSMCPADIIVHSEGEQTLLEVIKTLEGSGDLRIVEGISFRRDNGEVITTAPRKPIQNLDSIPFPAYDMLHEIEKYQPPSRKHVFSIMASRGCVHRCAFCSGNEFWKYQRYRSPENILAEIEWLTSAYEVGFLRFEDDDLLSKSAWARNLLKSVRGVAPPFSCLARFDSMKDDLPELLAAAGCVEVYHGLETTSPRLLKILRKELHPSVDLDYCRRMIKKEIDLGIAPTISAMIGIPTETEAEMQATVDFLLEMRHIGVRTQLWLLTPYPDTEIVRAYGADLVQIDRWKKFVQFDVFSEAAHEAYGKLLLQHRSIVPDWWMFANAAGIEKTGELYVRYRGKIAGVLDFV